MERMSIPALFDYLVNEVGGALGNEMAKDVVDTIKASIAAGNRESYTGTVSYADICAAFGDIERASTVTVYMKRHTLFTQVIAMTGEDGHPVFQQPPTADAAGVILGAQVKFEDAVGDGEILIGDSKKVVNNVVQDVMIETDKDIKKHVTTISGYARAEAGLADTKAFAIIAPSA
jgi:HK97 family phage major capsid protein